MKKFFVSLSLLFMVSVLTAQDKPVLVDSKWLNEHLNDPKLVVLQVNSLGLDYENEHIPRAVYLWPEYLTPNSPEGTFNAPDPARAGEVLQNLGVNNDSHVVVAFPNPGTVSLAARIFLTLEHLGLKGKVSFLDGGLEGWKKAGFSTSKELPVIKKGNFKASNNKLLVDKDYVIETLRTDKGLVVDARMKRYYDGEATGDPRDGHITGAKNIPYMDMFDQQSGMFKPLDSLEKYFTPVASKEKELVTYCFIGQTASVVYMAGRLLGYKMKVYDGSLQEWSRIQSLPMEKTPK